MVHLAFQDFFLYACSPLALCLVQMGRKLTFEEITFAKDMAKRLENLDCIHGIIMNLLRDEKALDRQIVIITKLPKAKGAGRTS